MDKGEIVPNYPVIIFDMDGLMIDSELLQSLSFKAVLKKHGVITKKKIVQILGVRVIENLEIMKKKFGIKEDIATLFQEKNEIYDQFLRKGIKPMPGLFSLIKLLSKNNFKLALASSSNFDTIQIVLKKLKFEKYFEVILSGDQVKKGKPDPEIYLKTAEKLEADPGQCLVFEDAQTGINSAKNAGMKCIAVPNIYTKNQDFSKADLRVKSLIDINIKTLFQVMGEEYLDIIDEQDKLIGRNTRKKVHDDFQIHRGVHIFVLNSKGELLLQKRSLKKDYYPGFYDTSVGAQVFAGETYLESALREVKEELGFQPKKLIKICDYKSYSKRQRENRRLFICCFEGPFKIDKNEVESIEFFPLKIIKDEIENNKKEFTEGFKISFDNYLKFISLEEVKKDLSFIAEELNSRKINWLLGGSGALMVHGIEIAPHDLDILVGEEDVKKLSDLKSKAEINGVEIQIIELDMRKAHPILIEFYGQKIPVNPLEEELGFYEKRDGKEKVVELIKEKLSKMRS